MFVKYKTMCKEHLFTRTEQDGTSLLLIKPSAHQVFLNKTGVKILDLAFNYEVPLLCIWYGSVSVW